MMDDRDQQRRASEPVTLDGPVDLPPALPREVIEHFAGIDKRRRLVKSDVYREHADALLEQTYGLQYRPASEPAPAEARDFLRVASWNIQRGIHLDHIKRYLSEHEHLRHADVILLNEVDIGMARSRNRDVSAELAEHLGFHCVFGNSYVCLDYGDPRDGRLGAPGDNAQSLHGNAILSRFPLLRAESFSLAISKDKFHSSEKRLGHKKALWAEVETPLGPLPVVAVHLDAYTSAASRGAQMEDVLRTVQGRGLADRVLLGGDLNTNTYDAGSAVQLCVNIWSKVLRGGFPHAIYHYVHPYEIYERPIFAALEAAGLDYHGFNAPEQGTTRYEVGTFESESTVQEQMPALAVKILRYKLRPWGGVAPLKVDWFAGRGLEVLAGEGGTHDGVALPLGPRACERPTMDGVSLSDHDPIVVDVRF